MATQFSNHLTLSMLSKGILGGSIGLITKGIISDFIEIIVTTKKGKKGGSSAAGLVGGKYDRDYWKRFQREVEEDGDEIDVILVKIKKKYLPEKYHISAELIRPLIEIELLEMQLYQSDNKPTINIELIEISTINRPHPKVTTTLINEEDVVIVDKKSNIKMELIDDVNEEMDRTDIKIKLIKESFIYKKEKP